MSRQQIMTEIEQERAYQQQRWGNLADDTLNTPNDFVSYITHHVSRWFNGGFAPYPRDTVDVYRKQMIKVAALAVAAVESIDRQRLDNNKTWYEVAA